VHLDREAAARDALQHLQALEDVAGGQGEALFASNIAILRLSLAAWLELPANGEAAVRLMEQAAELERWTPKHAVTPAPTVPAEELLGDLQMARRDFPEALAAYRRSLARYPHRFNSLLGAARAARSVGLVTVARACYRQLLHVASADGSRPALAEARAALDEPQAADPSSGGVACEP
jgi:tetratricopeptide (TPR) repeat protein